MAAVLEAVRLGGEVALAERQLTARGLLGPLRRRPTRRGRRCLEAARRSGALPAYVFDGPGAVTDRMFRRVVLRASLPSGLGGALRRTGKALDDEDGGKGGTSDHGGRDGDGGFSAGGGAGSGGD
ncbi:hypothetical protein [Streptomyces sp. NPDC090022]|uniref:hypothetical protein n=1 Tax=Streptomyces sp. NPDC090022 TaxID=3365920 RepID=UPI00381E6E47